MEKVHKSAGMICICAECHKVIRQTGNASQKAQQLVSHGICPECADKLYGEFFRKKP